jgi:hypothetical protein
MPTELEDGVDGPEPVVELPSIPVPSAEWLGTAANPIKVTLEEVGGRTTSDKISPAGGELSLSASDGTRIRLSIPPDALERSTDVTLTVVTGISGLPFAGGLVAAVRIEPADVMLRRSPLLQFETSRQVKIDPSQPMAGVAVRGGRELHLYPGARVEEPRQSARPRIMMPLTRFGVYAAAQATVQEIARVAQRPPTGYMARLEQQVGGAFFPRAASQRTRAWHALELLQPVYAAQAGTDDSGPVAVMLVRLLEQSREYYSQVVVPKFESSPRGDCIRSARATTDAIQTYFQWAALPALLLPIDRTLPPYERGVLVEQRRSLLSMRGLTDDQIAQIDFSVESLRSTIDELNQRGRRLVEQALKNQFAESYRCCSTLQPPLWFHRRAMVDVFRLGQLMSISVDDQAIDKIVECNCITNSRVPGAAEGLTGTVSISEEFDAEKTETRFRTNWETRKYSLTAVLRRPLTKQSLTSQQRIVLRLSQVEGASPDSLTTVIVADADATAEVVNRTLNTMGSSGCRGTVESQRTVTGQDSDAVNVAVMFNPDGTYRIDVGLLPLEGSGLHRQRNEWEGPECGPFTLKRNHVSLQQLSGQGIKTPGRSWVEGRVDPARPKELRGSQTFEIHDRDWDANRRVKVEWSLERCKL